jgi:hypothetical protein
MNKELLNCERVWLNVTPATLRPDLADYGLVGDLFEVVPQLVGSVG